MKQKTKLFFMVVLTLFFIHPGLSFGDEKKAKKSWPVIVDEVVAKAKKDINMIDMEAFSKVVENKGDAVIIDVREPNEFAAGHVPGSINIPRGVAEFKIWKKVAGFPDKTNTGITIYTYCKLAGRAILTTKALKDLGFTNITAVDMKVADWIKAGHPIER